MLSQVELENKFGLSPEACTYVLDFLIEDIETDVFFGQQTYEITEHLVPYFKIMKCHPIQLRAAGKLDWIRPFMPYVIYRRITGYDKTRIFKDVSDKKLTIGKNHHLSDGLISEKKIATFWNVFWAAVPKSIKDILKSKKLIKNPLWVPFLELLGLDGVFNDPTTIPEHMFKHVHHRIKLEAMLESALLQDQIVEICEVGFGWKMSRGNLKTYTDLFYRRDWMSTRDTALYFHSLTGGESAMKQSAFSLPGEDFCSKYNLPVAEKYLNSMRTMVDKLEDSIQANTTSGTQEKKDFRDDVKLYLQALAQMENMGVTTTDTAIPFDAMKLQETRALTGEDAEIKGIEIPALSEAVDGNTSKAG